MSNKPNSQRNTAYRAMIPFYILWDLDLTSNHLRFYGQIEQMENNHLEGCRPVFSYSWIAKQLGVSRRQAMYIAKKLKDKGYIQRVKDELGHDLWLTSKVPVRAKKETDSIMFDSEARVQGCSPTSPPSEVTVHPPSEPPLHLYNNPKNNSPEVEEKSIKKVAALPAATPSELVIDQDETLRIIKLEKQLFKNWLEENQSINPAINPIFVMTKLRADGAVQKIYKDKKLFLLWNSFDEFFFHLAEKARHRKTTMTVGLFKSWIQNERSIKIEAARPEDIFSSDQKIKYRYYRSGCIGDKKNALGIRDWIEAGEPER